MAEQRIKTGIPGFDKLVQGGFPIASSTLICGTPGTGKSIFSMQFIHNGAKKFKEKGLYVSFEQTEEEVRKQASKFGWDFKSLEKEGLVEIWYIPIEGINQDVVETIISKIKKNKFRRLVIDSISTLTINAPIYTNLKDIALIESMNKNIYFSPPIIGDIMIKRFIYGFINSIKGVDHCTSILIGESSGEKGYLSRDTVSEFICDGIVSLTFESMGGEFSRSLSVRKMRHTKNDEDIHPLEISDDNGIIVHDIK